MILKFILLGIYFLLQLYFAILILSFILSWIPGSRDWKITRYVYKISDWYMEPFMGKLILGIFDMGTLVGFIIYESITQFLRTCIYLL